MTVIKYFTGFGDTIPSVVLNWDDKQLLEDIKHESDKIAEWYARRVQKMARAKLKAEAKNYTGNLADDIEVEVSKYEGGGAAVEAQGPGNYDRFYATFVELGSVNNPQPIKYLRDPLNEVKKDVLKEMQDLFDK